MIWRKQYLLIKESFISLKKFLQDHSTSIVSVVKELTTSILVGLSAILFIPFFNDIISKYIEPYTLRLLDLDNAIFIFIDCIIIFLTVLTLLITTYKCKQKKIWNFPTILFNIFLFSCIIWVYESLLILFL